MCSSDLNNFPSDADANAKANASDYDVNKALHGGRSQPSVIRCKSADVSSASSLIRQEIFTRRRGGGASSLLRSGSSSIASAESADRNLLKIRVPKGAGGGLFTLSSFTREVKGVFEVSLGGGVS